MSLYRSDGPARRIPKRKCKCGNVMEHWQNECGGCWHWHRQEKEEAAKRQRLAQEIRAV